LPVTAQRRTPRAACCNLRRSCRGVRQRQCSQTAATTDSAFAPQASATDETPVQTPITKQRLGSHQHSRCQLSGCHNIRRCTQQTPARQVPAQRDTSTSGASPAEATISPGKTPAHQASTSDRQPSEASKSRCRASRQHIECSHSRRPPAQQIATVADAAQDASTAGASTSDATPSHTAATLARQTPGAVDPESPPTTSTAALARACRNAYITSIA
jgi:hypothetical protein